uniref:Transmembrane protein 65 n=1 Tax=Anopheles atroparvus TaxID=41427 RepID=A0AAG5DGK4_ANOAO
MSANVSCLVRVTSMMSQQCAKSFSPSSLVSPRLSHRIRGGSRAAFGPAAAFYRPHPTAQSGGTGGYIVGCNHTTAASKFFPTRDASRAYTQAASTLTREQLHDLVYRLNEDERELLMKTLKQFESNKVKAEFEVGLVNALPFIGFGFLDNFTMIIAGDYIEHTLGLFMCISTMAAAALGNTISDVIGIGSAFYVERLAEMSGVKPPKMSPIQLEMKASRRAANLGRVLGITIGCLLGMCPLLFMKEDKEKSKDKAKDKNKEPNAVAVAENVVSP